MSHRIFALLALLTLIPGAEATQICRKQRSPAPAMQIRNDGTVIDPRTGLQWQRCALGLEGKQCERGEALRLSVMKAQDRIYRLNQTGLAGHKDWRLPSIAELETLVSRDCVNPAIDLGPFPNTPALWFWTSSHEEGDTSSARYIDFRTGFTDEDDRNLQNPIRLVRTSKAAPR